MSIDRIGSSDLDRPKPAQEPEADAFRTRIRENETALDDAAAGRIVGRDISRKPVSDGLESAARSLAKLPESRLRENEAALNDAAVGRVIERHESPRRTDTDATRKLVEDAPGNLRSGDKNPVAIEEASKSPEAYAAARSSDLQERVPEHSRGRITMGVGVGTDSEGGVRVVVGTSEPRGYLRPGVTLRDGEELARGNGHAEVSILDHMTDRSIRPTYIAAGRPICSPCADSIDAADARTASPLKDARRTGQD